jgi:hypothetical protein
MAQIRDLARLRAIIGEPSAQVPHKIHRQLNQRARAFIARSPLLLLASVDAAGQPTVSPKGDEPGFVQVLDAGTLLLPERKGNKLIFSLQNLLANPRVGLIFLVPGTDETLRMSGSATLHDDPELCAACAARGRPALLAMRIAVSECYFHCAKAFLRSALWKPETWPERMQISFGAEIAQSGGLASGEIEAFDQAVQGRYRTDL